LSKDQCFLKKKTLLQKIQINTPASLELALIDFAAAHATAFGSLALLFIAIDVFLSY
jgi:hypothetical protein